MESEHHLAVVSGPQSGDDTLPAELRQRLAFQLVEQRGFVRVRELSERFGVSTVTARADLDALEHQGHVQRVHGGAMPVARTTIEQSFEVVSTVRSDEKTRIAAEAANMVSDGESIIIDVGTTTTALARELTRRTNLTDVTVFTNGLSIALELEQAHPRLTIIVIGGTLRPKQHSLVNPFTGPMLNDLQASTVFIGCNGVDLDVGITNVNLPEAAAKRSMLASAQRCVVLADSSKLGVRTLAPVCDLQAVDVLITDSRADVDLVSAMRERGIDVIVC